MKPNKTLKQVALTLSLCLLASCGSESSTSAETPTPTPAPTSTSSVTDNSQNTTESPLETENPESGEKTMIDRAGNEFTLPESMDRIISTAPSNTEILVALGLADQIAVVDVYSAGIEGISSDVLSVDFQSPDVEALLSAEGSILIASGMNMAGGEDPYAIMAEADVPVVYIPTSDSFASIYEDILFLGELTGTTEKAEELVEDMQTRQTAITDIVAGAETKSVYFEISPAPYLFTFGNGTFLNEAITLAGGVNIFGEEEGWFSPTEEGIILANPEVIITNATYMDDPAQEILSRENWQELTAVAENNVYAVDSDQSSRASHHVIDALEEIAKAIHPDLFQ